MALVATRRGVANCKLNTLTSFVNYCYGVTELDNEPSGDETTWELTAGSSIDLIFRVNTASSGLIANKHSRIVYYETGTGTVVRTFAADAVGALNTGVVATDTFYATSDGTVSGSPRAGTLRIYLRVIKDDGIAGSGNFNINSDDSPAATFDVALQNTPRSVAGGLRANKKASNITVNAYPAGAMFASTGAGEVITATVTHTQPYAVRGHEDIRIDVIDATTQQIAGTVKDIGSGTSTTQNFTVGNGFDVASKSYGFRFLPVGNAQLVFTSGATLWTKFIDDGANVEQDGNNVMRQSFYTVDPRTFPRGGGGAGGLTSRGCLFHTQASGSEMKDPPSSGDTDSGQRVFADIAYLSVRYLNARGEGINGATVTLKCWDAGNISYTESSPAHTFSGTTATRRADAPFATPQAGWLPLADTGVNNDKLPVTWSAVVSGTWRVKSVLTAPANLVGLEDYQFSSAGEFWNRNVFLIVFTTNYAPICNIGQLDNTKTGRHMEGGEDLFAYAFMQDLNQGGALVKLVEANGDGVTLDINTVYSSTGRLKYIDPADNTWKEKTNDGPIPQFTLGRASVFVAGGDPDIWVKAITGIVGAAPGKDFNVHGIITKDGVTYAVDVSREVTSTKNRHDNHEMDGLEFSVHGDVGTS